MKVDPESIGRRRDPVIPPAPQGVDFGEAIDELMDTSRLTERYDHDFIQLRADTVLVLEFMVRWILDENTGNAPNLYDRAKRDFEAWQKTRGMLEGGELGP